MSFDLALRLTECLIGFAFVLQSLEHLTGGRFERVLFAVRLGISVLLIAGLATPVACLALLGLAIIALHRFNGPYNGGSDRMGILILVCLSFAHWAPNQTLSEYALGYLAIQLILSYVISGWVKIVEPDWRSGAALRDVFGYSAYPVSEAMRGLTQRSRLLLTASWAVMVFELLFPLSLVNRTTLLVALSLAALFHLSNAICFGLNRFFWTWIAAFPSIIWFQDRFIGGPSGLLSPAT